MNIIVLNGSPHGLKGISSQYTKFLEIKFPDHNFVTFEIAKNIKKLERNNNYFVELVKQIENADALVWAFPVYTMLIPSQLKYFIELLFERNVIKILKGKLATSISTSANFYDHTAHEYMHGISVDLGLKYVKGFSPEMKDLLSEAGRNNLIGFANDFFWKVRINNNLNDNIVAKINWDICDLRKTILPVSIQKTGDQKIVIISDANPTDFNLNIMLDLFERLTKHKVKRIELSKIDIKGGCIACLQCGNGDDCFYKDGYAEAFAIVKKADIVIYAGAVKDRYYSARFKKFMDRYFSNGHRHILSAGLLGHIVSGPLNQLQAMKETLEAHIEVAHCQRLGIISDDHPDPQVIVNSIRNMIQFMEHWLDSKKWISPQTFLGVGGGKIFRDLVYFNRGVMGADYRFYKKEKLFDFPNVNLKQRLIGRALMILQKIPAMQKEFKSGMNDNRLKPYRKILAASAGDTNTRKGELSKALLLLASILPPIGIILYLKFIN